MKRYILTVLVTLSGMTLSGMTVSDVAAQVAVPNDDYLSAIADTELEITPGTLLGNDLLNDTFDGLDVEGPQWGRLIEEEIEGKPFFRYEVTAQEILPSVNGIDYFTYRIESGTAVSELAYVFIKVYPDRTPLAGRWRDQAPSVETESGLGWFDAATSTFRLCRIRFFPNGDGYMDDCRSLVVPVKVAGGGEPLVGDWDGDGFDDLGIYDPWGAMFHLYTFPYQCGEGYDCAGLVPHARFSWGKAGSVPVAGDWNGDGHDVVGLYDPAEKGFWLLHSNSDDAGADWVAFNPKGRPVAGQWNVMGSGLADSVGVFDRTTHDVHYKVGGGVVTRKLSDLPELGMPFSFSWTDFSWLGVRDPADRVMLLLSHPDLGKKTRRVSVPKDP